MDQKQAFVLFLDRSSSENRMDLHEIAPRDAIPATKRCIYSKYELILNPIFKCTIRCHITKERRGLFFDNVTLTV